MVAAKMVYLLALVVWIGEIVFLSFVAAPAAFKLLPREQAGAFVGSTFPIYYVIGCTCGVLLLLSCLVLRHAAMSPRLWGLNAALIAAMLAANLYAAVFVQPRAAALRPQLHAPGTPAGVQEEFDRLHQLAVTLNGAVLLGGLAVCGITASALRP